MSGNKNEKQILFLQDKLTTRHPDNTQGELTYQFSLQDLDALCFYSDFMKTVLENKLNHHSGNTSSVNLVLS